MTEQEINIAIAEFCGVCTHPEEFRKTKTIEDGNDSDTSYECKKCGKDYIYDSSAKVPNYFGDLNAVHEAEKLLPVDLLKKYNIQIGRLIVQLDKDEYWENPLGDINTYTFHATAPQRSEALLRTIGKWKD